MNDVYIVDKANEIASGLFWGNNQIENLADILDNEMCANSEDEVWSLFSKVEQYEDRFGDYLRPDVIRSVYSLP